MSTMTPTDARETMTSTRHTVAVIMMALFVSCAPVSRRESLEREVQELLVERSKEKSWIDFSEIEDPAERRARLREAIRASRSGSRYYDLVRVSGLLAAAARGDATGADDAEPAPSGSAASPEPALGQDGDGVTDDAESATARHGFEFRGSSLSDVVQLIAAELGINILVPRGLDQAVTASMPDVDPRSGLELILKSNGYALEEKSGIYTIVPSDDARLITRVFKLDTAIQIDTSKELIPILGEGGVVSSDPDLRALVITATAEGLERAEQYLAIVDERPKQVIIEALIVEVAHSDGFRHGSLFSDSSVSLNNNDDDIGTIVANLLPNPPTGTSTNPITFGFTNADQAIEFLFSIDESINKLHVVHSPFITATSGRQATLKVIETIPYIQATTSIGATEGESDGTVTSAEEIEFEETGVTLTVTPQIGVDDVVEVEIQPKIEELVEFLSGVPVIDTRESDTTVMVKNRQTIVIGGLLRDSWNHVEVRVPYISRIPLIGELFKSKEVRKEKIELLMFLTPQIVSVDAEDEETKRAFERYTESEQFRGARKLFDDRGTQGSKPRGVRD